MPEFQPGIYVIVPAIAPPKQALGIGPVPAIHPLPDVPVRIIGPQLIDKWLIRRVENNTFTVFAGKGEPEDYKWTVRKADDLFVTSVHPAESFRFESAGNDLWVIGRFGEDAVLTANLLDFPQLTFKHADGSLAQRFKAIPVLKE